MKFTIAVPATTANLGPGFDSFALALGLCNTVTVETGVSQLAIVLRGQTSVPRDESNLVYRSLRSGLELVGSACPPVRLTLDNRIPIGKGLGSSAAAIVGGLVAAHRLAGRRLSPDQLLARAVEIEGHPDNVAAALFGGLVIVTRDGDRWVWARVRPPKELRAVLWVPEQALSTRLARGLVPLEFSRADAVFNAARTGLLAHAFHARDWPLLRVAMQDRLHQPYRAQAVPGLSEMIEAALAAGAYGSALSGAGPSILALVGPQAEKVRRAMRGVARRLGLTGRVRVLPLAAAGAGGGTVDSGRPPL